MKLSLGNLLVWFAVLGGAAAWAVQFVVNLFFTFAQCRQPGSRWDLPLHSWEIGLSLGGIAVALAAEGVSAWLFVSTYRINPQIPEQEIQGKGTAPPVGRITFLAMVGLTVNFLVLAIMVMTGIGAPLLQVCQQS